MNTEPPPDSTKDRPNKRWRVYLGANSLAVSILLHVLFGVGAAYLVVQHFQKKHINFQAAAPPSPNNEVEHKVEVTKKNNVESAPPDLKRIVTTDVSPITLPDVPQLPTPDAALTPTMAGLDGAVGSGMGSGGGNGGGGGGGVPLFGDDTGEGLVGRFWDLKQTPDRKPTEMADNAWEQAHPTESDPNREKLHSTKVAREFLRSFVTSWDVGKLEEYYEAPVTLYAPQLFIPTVPSPEAPKAFHVEKTVPSARRWIIVYKATIIPPKSGDFRFIGFADDYMVVRIDSENVLDASYAYGALAPSANVHEDVGPGPGSSKTGALRCGTWVHMQSGIAMHLQVLIGEDPGGYSSFFLFIQEKGVDTPKGDYPVFQLRDVAVPNWTKRALVPPNCTKKKMVFGLGS